jgi:DNA-binding CsgD family transcriptional regulator
MIDYTGVSMEVILSDFRSCRDNTTRSIEKLKQLKHEVEARRNEFYYPDRILAYINFFIDLFGKYLGDFQRLMADLPRKVLPAHIHIVRQIADSAEREEKRCVRFKHENIEDAPAGDGRALDMLVDNIYTETREMLIDYWDLSQLATRLRTFVGATMHASNGLNSDPSLTMTKENSQAARGNAKVNAPLPPRKMDFGRWMDEADLTERQRDCFSLRFEYELSVSEISRRLGISRPSVDKHIAAAHRRINQVRTNDSSMRKSLTKRNPE